MSTTYSHTITGDYRPSTAQAKAITGQLNLLRGMPWGHTVSKNGSDFFFSFAVATNLYIKLFIKLSPLQLGMYCSHYLQQKQANQNPFLSLISRGRGTTHPYLCDVKASFDFFIKTGLNLAPYC